MLEFYYLLVDPFLRMTTEIRQDSEHIYRSSLRESVVWLEIKRGSKPYTLLSTYCIVLSQKSGIHSSAVQLETHFLLETSNLNSRRIELSVAYYEGRRI